MTNSPSSDNWQATTRQQIETALADTLNRSTPAARLNDAMRHSLLAGGKRLRPLLCIAACELFQGNTEQALVPACAVEMLHTYSLIHDDLPAMDDDDLRRGQPSCHKAFDDATAILAGDALQTLSFELLSSHGELTPKQRLVMLNTLTQAAGAHGMIGGQMLDMQAEGKPIDQQQLEQIHRLKTGQLIKAALLMGAHAANVTDAEQLSRIQQIGDTLGLAFQVQDDILDVIGNTELLGKNSGADQQHNKSTYPALMGLKASQDYVQQLHQTATNLLSIYGAKAAHLQQLANEIIQREN